MYKNVHSANWILTFSFVFKIKIHIAKSFTQTKEMHLACFWSAQISAS